MKFRHHVLLVSALCLAFASPGFASQRSVLRQSITPNANKSLEATEKFFNPLSGRPVANADVPEVEPNDDIAGANPISCGDDFRPAAIDPADDFDTLVMTANAGDLITFGTNADGAGDVEDTIIGIFDDLGNLIDSDDDSGPGFYSLLSDIPAPYTGTYYLAVIGFDATLTGNYQAFVRCTAAPTPPSNDTCLGAIKLDCKDFTVAGTTAGAFNDYTPTLTPPTGCTGFTANGADVVYLVTLPDGGSIDLVYTSSADASVYLVNDCVSPSDAACVAGADLTFAGEPETLSYVNTSGSAQTLYLILDSFGTGSFGTYTLTGRLSCPPVPVQATTWGSIKAIYKQ